MIPGPSSPYFVNRTPELARLWSSLDQALEGKTRVAVVSGEPGIGKTRLLGEFARRVRQSHIPVVTGICDEGSHIGFEPWRQIIRAWMDGRESAEVRDVLGIDALRIAHLIPELREILHSQEERTLLDPMQDRVRLFAAVMSWISRAASRSPLVIILDDLQMADQSSLELLEYLVGETKDVPLLLVLSYRDVEVSRGHLMVQTLAKLSRSTRLLRLPLRGLSEADTARLATDVSGIALTATIASVLQEQTGGNPLYVAELSKLLSESGRFEDLLAVHESHLPFVVGVRETVSQRLGRLSDSCNSMMTRASVLGHTLQLSLVEQLCDLTEDQLLDAVDEALQAGLLLETDGGGELAFLHGIVHEVIYSDFASEDRSCLHRLAGQILVERAGGDDARALPQIARHFYYGVDPLTSSAAISYCRRAGEQALRQLSYVEAAKQVERAIDVLTRYRQQDAAMHCELLLDLGEARHLAADSRGAAAAFRLAAERARNVKDAERLGRAAVGYATAATYLGVNDLGQIGLLEEASVLLRGWDHPIRVRVLSHLTNVLVIVDSLVPDREQRAADACQEALQIANRLGEPASRLMAVAARQRWFMLQGPSTVEQRIANASAIIELADHIGDLQHLLYGYACRIQALVERGDLEAAERANQAYERLAVQYQLPNGIWASRCRQAMFELVRGNLEDAERLATEAMTGLGHDAAGDAATVLFVQLCLIRREQGRAEEALQMADDLISDGSGGSAVDAFRTLMLCEAGRLTDAQALFEQLAHDEFAAIPQNLIRINSLAVLAEICVWLDDRQRTGTLYSFLKPHDGLNASGGGNVVSFGATAYYLARLAALQGDKSTAARHFEDALTLNRKMGATLFTTRIEAAYGAMLLTTGQPQGQLQAEQMLKRALGTCQERGMIALEAEIKRALIRTLGE